MSTTKVFGNANRICAILSENFSHNCCYRYQVVDVSKVYLSNLHELKLRKRELVEYNFHFFWKAFTLLFKFIILFC